jgi:RNA polymerase sigma-70 factor (ECF subfamily)
MAKSKLWKSFVQKHAPPAEYGKRMSGQHSTHQEQFMRLFIASEPEVLRYILAVIPDVNDARDVLQETAAALWRKMDAYDPAAPFTPWACRFASNEIRAFLRREQRQRRWLDEDVAELLRTHQERAPEQEAAQAEHLRECLEALPPAQHELLRRYYFEEQTVEAIARALHRTADAVYKTLQRSRQALADCVKRKQEAAA